MDEEQILQILEVIQLFEQDTKSDSGNLQLWLISFFLTVISVLMLIISKGAKMIWGEVKKKANEMIQSQFLFIEEMADMKKTQAKQMADIAKIMGWLKSHEKRIDNLD